MSAPPSDLIAQANAEVDILLPAISRLRESIDAGTAEPGAATELRKLVHRLRNQVCVLEIGGVDHGLSELLQTLSP